MPFPARRPQHRSLRRARIALAALSSVVLFSSCGKTLGSLVTEAMDGCIAARNPAFKSGAGATALATPLPPLVAKQADKIAYARGLTNLSRVAEQARDQVTLVCALEIASHYKQGDVAVLLYKYTKHPDAAVAQNAKKLLQTTQDPLPAGYGQ